MHLSASSRLHSDAALMNRSKCRRSPLIALVGRRASLPSGSGGDCSFLTLRCIRVQAKAAEHGLPDAGKAVRVVLEYACVSANSSQAFSPPATKVRKPQL